MTKARIGRGYSENSSYHSPSYAPSMASSKRASLLSVASSLFKPRESAARPLSPANSNAPLPDLIEISPPSNSEDYERERLREIAARAIGILPTDFDATQAVSSNPNTEPVPAFPATRSKLPASAVLLASDRPLQKYYPSASLRMFMAKPWKPRFLLLSHQPDSLWFLHTFRDELEVERLEIVHTSFISVAEEQVGGKKGGVIAVAGKDASANEPTSVWHFHIPDSKEAQRWIDQVKSVILALRTLRESIPLSFQGGPSPILPQTAYVSQDLRSPPLSPPHPVGDMDTVLSMRKQGLLTITSLSPTRSTFSASTDGGEGHRNSNSLSSKTSISTSQKEKEKTTVQALRGLFTHTSATLQQNRNTETQSRPRSASAATSIRSFLSAPHQEDLVDDRTNRDTLLSGWTRSTSPLPSASASSANKRLPVSGAAGTIATPIASQLDRKISEAHYPNDSSWATPPTAVNDPPEFSHPFANGGQLNAAPSAAEILAKVNQRASVFSSRPTRLGIGPTVLQPPPRRPKSSVSAITSAPSSFTEEGRRMHSLNNPSLTGLGTISPNEVTEEPDKHSRDLTFGHSRGQGRQAMPPTHPPTPIPIPDNPSMRQSPGPGPSLTPPSTASTSVSRSRRFSRQAASYSGLPTPRGPPPSGPLPEAPAGDAMAMTPPRSSASLRKGAGSLKDHALDDDDDDGSNRHPLSSRLSPGRLTNSSISKSPLQPDSASISISSVEPSSVEEVYASRSMRGHDDDEDEDEQEERRSVLSTLPTFLPTSKRASTGSANGLSGGYHSPPLVLGRDSLDGADTSSFVGDKDNHDNLLGLQGISSYFAGNTRDYRGSIPPPQRGPAPITPLPPAPAPGSPELPRSSMEDSRSIQNGILPNGSRRLSSLSMSSAISSGNGSTSSTDLLPPAAHRFRDRAARMSRIAPKPPPSMALPEIPAARDSPQLPVASLPVPPRSSPTNSTHSLPMSPPQQPHHPQKEVSSVGRHLSKRLRFLSAPTANPLNRSASLSSPHSLQSTSQQPSTESYKSFQSASSAMSTTSSFLQIHTPLTPNIPLPKVHSSHTVDEKPLSEGLSPPPRRSSWGNKQISALAVNTTTTTSQTMSVIDDDTPTTAAMMKPTDAMNLPGGGGLITPTNSPPVKGKDDAVSLMTTTSTTTNEDKEKPTSTASSVISLRVQV